MSAVPKPRKVPASKLLAGVSVTIERSFGTATGCDAELSALRRFLEYQTARFLTQRAIGGRWQLLVYVSRTEEL